MCSEERAREIITNYGRQAFYTKGSAARNPYGIEQRAYWWWLAGWQEVNKNRSKAA